MSADDGRPYLIFRRTLNVGRKVQLDKKTKKPIPGTGERQEDWTCELTDENGEACSWATERVLLKYRYKGWRLIGGGGFDEWLRRKDDPENDLVKAMHTLKIRVAEILSDRAEADAKEQEIQELKAKLAASQPRGKANERPNEKQGAAQPSVQKSSS